MASNESTRGEEPGNDRSTASNNTSAHSDNAPGDDGGEPYHLSAPPAGLGGRLGGDA